MPQRSHIPLAALGLVVATVAALSARTGTVVDAPADEVSTRLYECRSATGRVYSDKPCGPHATDTGQNARCDALFRRKARLDSRMRAGYSGPAGERLRAEHRDVTKELYTRRCSKHG